MGERPDQNQPGPFVLDDESPRVQAFREYVRTDAFREDLEKASELVAAGDTEGIAEFVTRNIEQRAEEAAARSRGGRDG